MHSEGETRGTEGAVRVELGPVLVALSRAVEMAVPAIAAHQLRVACIADRMAEAAGVSATDRGRIFVAACLHDIGALDPLMKVALHQFEDVSPGPHCAIGAELLGLVPGFSSASQLVADHHTPASDLHGGIDRPWVLGAQILFAADHAERFIDRDRYILHQHHRVRARVACLPPEDLHPDVQALFFDVSATEAFWLDLCSDRVIEDVQRRAPALQLSLGSTGLRRLGGLFCSVVDYRTPMTSTHSAGVAMCAPKLGNALGLSSSVCDQLAFAGAVHDLGKMVIPNSILGKPGGLESGERAVILQHSHRTGAALRGLRGLADPVRWAAGHHERLDGTGYPGRRGGRDIDLGTRVVAVADVFAALTEPRPYRGAMSAAAAAEELGREASHGRLDRRCVEALRDNLRDISGLLGAAQSVARSDYDGLMARA